MKRIMGIAFALLVVLSAFALSASAVKKTAIGDEDIGVFVSVNHTPAEGEHKAPLDGGRYTVDFGEGAVITVTPDSPDDSLSLVVYPVPATDTEAYAWFKQSTAKLGENRLYFDIYFVNDKGERVLGGKATAEITPPADYALAKTALVNKDGSFTELDAAIKDGKASFEITDGGFYAMAEAFSEESSSDDSSDTETDTPSTGDGAEYIWVIIALMSAVLATVSVNKRKS